MEVINYIILSLYFGSLVFILVYCLAQFHLLLNYRFPGKSQKSDLSSETSEFPHVTIQLPIFNEQFVTERLIDSVMKINYPMDKLEVQVLDDSTDETVSISEKKVNEYKKKGFDIVLITRTDRKGFKAGALQNGLKTAKGEFVAIFDADFMPQTNFLTKTLPHFNDSNIGVVQTRWDHINKKYSVLTKAQAFQLDVHFSVEQKGRNNAGYFINFNGTAGIWRKTCINDAGGWQADTLTEDLDLSYRAQLNGWKFKYLEDVESPAELPAEMNGLKSQQFRWTKGGAEVAKKLLPKVWRSNIPFSRKIHATTHLMSSSIFIAVLACAILSVPMVMILGSGFEYGILKYSIVFLVSILSIVFIYMASTFAREGFSIRSFFYFLWMLPTFLSLSMGMSLHNSVAVMEGLMGKKSAFIRTPKFNIRNKEDQWADKQVYIKNKVSALTITEGILSLYFIGGIVLAFVCKTPAFLIFHIMLALGFGAIFLYSMKHAR